MSTSVDGILHYYIIHLLLQGQIYSLYIAYTPGHSLAPTSQAWWWRTRVTQKKPNWQPPHHHWVWWWSTCLSSLGHIQEHLLAPEISLAYSLLLFFEIFSHFAFSLLLCTVVKCIYASLTLTFCSQQIVSTVATPHKCKGKEGKTCKCFLPCVNKDLHDLIVTCCGQSYSFDLHCDACPLWSADKWSRVQAYIGELQWQRKRTKEKRKKKKSLYLLFSLALMLVINLIPFENIWVMYHVINKLTWMLRMWS